MGAAWRREGAGSGREAGRPEEGGREGGIPHRPVHHARPSRSPDVLHGEGVSSSSGSRNTGAPNGTAPPRPTPQEECGVYSANPPGAGEAGGWLRPSPLGAPRPRPRPPWASPRPPRAASSWRGVRGAARRACGGDPAPAPVTPGRSGRRPRGWDDDETAKAAQPLRVPAPKGVAEAGDRPSAGGTVRGGRPCPSTHATDWP